MQSKAKIIEPEGVEIELTVKMTLREWSQLLGQITGDSYPAWEFKSHIKTSIGDVLQVFHGSAVEPPPS